MALRRWNPLKKAAFETKLGELQRDFPGSLVDFAADIKLDFNGEHNSSSHALYILGWWKARLSLQKFLASYDVNELISHGLAADAPTLVTRLQNKFNLQATEQAYQNVARFYANYKIKDYHDVNLDAELQIDYYHTLRHYAQMAATQPLFRRAWPQIPPSDLIKFLRELEAGVQDKRFFKPQFHDVLISFPNGYAWTAVRKIDAADEGRALSDCGTPENTKSLILSLRKPIPDSEFYEPLLHLEIVFPVVMTSDKWVKKGNFDQPGIMIQCRGRANSIPKEEYHPYIYRLLQEDWVTHLLLPDYQPERTFKLEQLSPELNAELQTQKPWLYDINLFFEKFGHKAFPSKIQAKLLDVIQLPLWKSIEIIDAPRVSPALRFRAIEELKKELQQKLMDPTSNLFASLARKDRKQRRQILKSLTSFLLKTKDRDLIYDISNILEPYQRGIRFQFLMARQAWLAQHPKYFIRLFLDAIKHSSRDIASAHRVKLPLEAAEILIAYIKSGYYQPVIYLLFYVGFDCERHYPRSDVHRFPIHRLINATGRQMLRVLQVLLTTFYQNPSLLEPDLCKWIERDGRHRERWFPTAILLDNRTINLLTKMMGTGNYCLLLLVSRIIRNISNINSYLFEKPELRYQFLIQAIAKLFMRDDPKIRDLAYKMLFKFQ